VEEALIRADVGVTATDAILESLRRQKLKPEDLGEALRTELVGILDRIDRTFRFSGKGPSVWLVAGVNGTGKTTSIAKLAKMLQDEGKTVVSLPPTRSALRRSISSGPGRNASTST